MKTIIYGNGSMAKVLYSYARHSMDICGFTVDDICIAEGTDSFLGLPLVPFSQVENKWDTSSHNMILAIGYIDLNALREQKYIEAQEKGFSFTRFIHPSVIQHDGVTIGENCILLDHVSVHPGCQIDVGTFISSNVNIGHDCIIENHNWINSGVAIAGGCTIGAGSFFGVNASVGHGVKVGVRNFIAANTLINRSTEDEQVYLSEPGLLFKLKSKAFLKFSQLMK
ncbi:MAG: acetyltransferase [Pseudomonadota bacterium]